MDPVWLFIGALAVLHVIEGFLWVRRDALAIAAGWMGYHWYKPGGPLGSPREVLIPLSPLPPLSETFVVEPWPLTMSADRVWLVPSQRLSEALVPPAQAPGWTWQEAGRVRRDGRTIEGPRGLSVRASSGALAQFLVERLHEGAALKTKKRARQLERWLNEAHQQDAIKERLKEFSAIAWRLRFYGNILLPTMFLGAYGFFFIGPIAVNWPILVGGLLSMLLLVWIETWWAHRRLYPKLRGDRWMAMTMMVLSPPAAIRAYGWLARDVLASFHPLAVGAALLPDDEFKRLCEVAWRDLSFPLGPEDPEAFDDLEGHRQGLKDALRRAASNRDVDVEAFEGPPSFSEEGAEAYCPRCLEVFRSAEGECPDCPGVARKPWPAPPRRRRHRK